MSRKAAETMGRRGMVLVTLLLGLAGEARADEPAASAPAAGTELRTTWEERPNGLELRLGLGAPEGL